MTSRSEPFGLKAALVTFKTNVAGAQIVQTIGPLRQVLSGPADAAAAKETERFLLVTPADSDTPALIQHAP